MYKFMIFGNARSGTGTLFKLFRDLDVVITHEPFYPSKWPCGFDLSTEAENLYRTHDAAKHLYNHLTLMDNLELVNWLLEKEIRIIYLKRRNLFLNAISKALAQMTGKWDTDTSSRETASASLHNPPSTATDSA